MTKNPFGVNLTLLPALVPPDYAAYAQVIIDEGIKIVETAGNNPGPVIQQLKKANTTILHKCTTVRHALSAVKLGVDFLSIDGFECAGHVGEHDITNFILLSRARQELKVPFIASGGFADGQGLAAALALGAEGINMGTRFMCTVEAPIHHDVKKAIVKAQETDTALVLRRWKNTTRLFKNTVSMEAIRVEKESTSGEFSDVAPFVSGKRGREVFLNGDVNFGVSTYPTSNQPPSLPIWDFQFQFLTCHRSGLPVKSSGLSMTSRHVASCWGASRRKLQRLLSELHLCTLTRHQASSSGLVTDAYWIVFGLDSLWVV